MSAARRFRVWPIASRRMVTAFANSSAKGLNVIFYSLMPKHLDGRMFRLFHLSTCRNKTTNRPKRKPTP